MPETPETTPALSRIETLAKMIADQVSTHVNEHGAGIALKLEDAGVDYESARAWIVSVVEPIARAVISDSPLRFPDELAMEPVPPPQHIDIVFDGPPGPTSGRFVEVEDPSGRSIKAGEWINRPDGMSVLRIPTIVVGPFYEQQRGGRTAMVAPTVHEARLLEAAGALALKAGASDNPKVAGLGHAFAAQAAQVVEDARMTRAAAVIGREILCLPSPDSGPLITEDELHKATAIVAAYLGRQVDATPGQVSTLDAEASDILVRAYADRMSTLIDLVDAMVMRDAKAGTVMCAHCGKHYPSAGIREHVETCAMSRVVVDLRQAKEDHGRAAHLVAQLYHAATGRPWGDGPIRGVVEDVGQVWRDLDRHRVQLAGVLAALEGHHRDPAIPSDYGWSLPYQKAIELRASFDAARTVRDAELQEAIDHAYEIERDERAGGRLDSADAMRDRRAGLERLRVALMLEHERQAMYAELTAGGLSDAEASGTAWPAEIFAKVRPAGTAPAELPRPAPVTIANGGTITLGLAERMFNAYGEKAGWLTHDGKRMPPWSEVGDAVQARWTAAAQEARVSIGELQRSAVAGFIEDLKSNPPPPPPANVRGRITSTRTMALMEITPAAYTEIKGKLEDAGYDRAIHVTRGERETLDLHGIGLVSI
jgi:hypothetical protein